MQTKTAWVIHNEDSWREGIAALLTRHGFTVTEMFMTKNEASARLKTIEPGQMPQFISSDALGGMGETTIEKLGQELNHKGVGHVVLSLASTGPIEQALAKYAHYRTASFMRKGAVEFHADAFDEERFLALAEASILAAQNDKAPGA